MANVDAPFGFKLLNDFGPNHTDMAESTLDKTYATKVSFGDPIMAVASGGIERLSAGQPILGFFKGVRWKNADGSLGRSNTWEGANADASNIVVEYEPVFKNRKYVVQVDGSMTATDVWNNADVVAADGDSIYGSKYQLSATTSAGVAQWKIVGLWNGYHSNGSKNKWGANPRVVVIPNEAFLEASAGI